MNADVYVRPVRPWHWKARIRLTMWVARVLRVPIDVNGRFFMDCSLVNAKKEAP